jgi:hypothetical protein
MADELRSPIKHHLVLHRIDTEKGIRHLYSLRLHGICSERYAWCAAGRPFEHGRGRLYQLASHELPAWHGGGRW